jgi:hypothetical protein
MFQANNIEQYKEFIGRYVGYKVFYRGQSEGYTTSISSIARDGYLMTNESKIYNEAITMGEQHFHELNSPMERLSKMQHYSIPTRLIDISVDSLKALYFATENTEEEYGGLVRVYLPKVVYSYDDKRVRLLALLATLENYEISYIQNEFRRIYNLEISPSEILSFGQESVFIEYSEGLKKSNTRLLNQRGTFFICGNEVENNNFLHRIKSLDEISPIVSIYIPYEYKSKIKKDLDAKEGINTTLIYPELPSIAIYLIEKYKPQDFSLKETYSLINSTTPRFHERNLFLDVVLKKNLTIDQIKLVAIDAIQKNQEKFDVVNINIAKAKADCVSLNWVLQGQWINPRINEKDVPVKIGAIDENGYGWRFGQSYKVMSDYFDEYFFDDDRNLLMYHNKIYEETYPCFLVLRNTFEKLSLDEFSQKYLEFKPLIDKAFWTLNDFGHSRDAEFDKYLDHYLTSVSWLDSIDIPLRNSTIPESEKKRIVSLDLGDAQKYFEFIEKDNNLWMERIGINKDEYQGLNPFKFNKKKYTYTPTLPISPDAVIVKFEEKIEFDKNNFLCISGVTNLFDGAELLLSVRENDNKWFFQDKSSLENGRFSFKPLDVHELTTIIANANITVAIPSVQPKGFIQKAGIEYERIDGPLVDRSGVGPIIRYDFKITKN